MGLFRCEQHDQYGRRRRLPSADGLVVPDATAGRQSSARRCAFWYSLMSMRTGACSCRRGTRPAPGSLGLADPGQSRNRNEPWGRFGSCSPRARHGVGNCRSPPPVHDNARAVVFICSNLATSPSSSAGSTQSIAATAAMSCSSTSSLTGTAVPEHVRASALGGSRCVQVADLVLRARSALPIGALRRLLSSTRCDRCS